MSEQITIADQLTPIADRLVRARVPLHAATVAIERKIIDIALIHADGNITKAAQILGIHRNSLHNKLRGARKQR